MRLADHISEVTADFNPAIERQCDVIVFWWCAKNRAEATKKADVLANCIGIEGDMVIPWMRRGQWFAMLEVPREIAESEVTS